MSTAVLAAERDDVLSRERKSKRTHVIHACRQDDNVVDALSCKVLCDQRGGEAWAPSLFLDPCTLIASNSVS